MSYTVDAMGKACPTPVILAKKALDAGQSPLTVLVDNQIAVENLRRLGASSQLQVEVSQIQGGFAVQLGGGVSEQAAAPSPTPAEFCTPAGCGTAVFIGKDHVGEGDPTLGRNLMKMAIYTLAESDDVPSSVLFMNSGVQLVAGEEPQVVESCNKLIERGCEILVCGTCLNFYGITDKLEVGEVSNMYDILSRMQEAGKTITL